MKDAHFLPVNDLREHIPERTCWCKPTPQEDEPRVVVHHSLDGREDYESGKRKFS